MRRINSAVVLHERYTSGEGRYCTAIFGVLEPDGDGRVNVHLASGGSRRVWTSRISSTSSPTVSRTWWKRSTESRRQRRAS
ncbi:hypothetical protein PUR28_02345, partial [Streptomyces sp. BE308]|nr:hypothetical protein [Streptomyces sp. BE308]